MDWTALVKTIAPWLTAAAAGPAGLAGMAITKAAEALGASAATADSITQAIAGATPEQLAALKKADQDFELQMQALGFQNIQALEKIAADDRNSARVNNVAGGVSKDVFWMSVVLLIACIGAELVVLFHGYPPGVADVLVGRILGMLDTTAAMVLAYHYGTTRDSGRKTELLAQSEPVK